MILDKMSRIMLYLLLIWQNENVISFRTNAFPYPITHLITSNRHSQHLRPSAGLPHRITFPPDQAEHPPHSQTDRYR